MYVCMSTKIHKKKCSHENCCHLQHCAVGTQSPTELCTQSPPALYTVTSSTGSVRNWFLSLTASVADPDPFDADRDPDHLNVDYDPDHDA